MVISKRFRAFIPLILTLLLAILLLFLVQDFLETVIIRPLLYVVWFLGLIMESLPQWVIWAGVLLIMSIIAYSSLKKGNPEKHLAGQLLPRNSGRVEKWTRLLAYAQSDRFAKWRLANELKRLTTKLASPSSDNVENIDLNDLELPAEIIAFFQAQQPQITPFWKWMNKDTNQATETALDLDPEVVIQYLEKQHRP